LAPVADRGAAQDPSRSGQALGVLAGWIGACGRVTDHELLDKCQLVGVLGRGFVDRVRDHAVRVVFEDAASVPYLEDATDLGTNDPHPHLLRAGREYVGGLGEWFPVLGEPEHEVHGDRTTGERRRFGRRGYDVLVGRSARAAAAQQQRGRQRHGNRDSRPRLPGRVRRSLGARGALLVSLVLASSAVRAAPVSA